MWTLWWRTRTAWWRGVVGGRERGWLCSCCVTWNVVEGGGDESGFGEGQSE